MNVYILTSDKSIHIIKGLQYCINKYWKPNPYITVLGYKKPSFKLDNNFKFISLGVDRGPDYVGEDLINFFNNIKDKHFIFSVDDFFPIRNMNIDILNNLSDKMINENISRISLTDQVSSKPYSVISELDDYEIIEMGQEANYRKSAVWSIWSKKYFLKYFYPKMNLWEWELDEICKGDGYRVIGTYKRYVLQSCHLYKQGNLKSDWYKDSESSDMMFGEDHAIISDIIYS